MRSGRAWPRRRTAIPSSRAARSHARRRRRAQADRGALELRLGAPGAVPSPHDSRDCRRPASPTSAGRASGGGVRLGVGQEFWPTVVGELMAQPEAGEADLHLESLLDKELIRAGSTRLAGEQALRFSHIVIRDVAYQTILKDTRARLHESVASWLQGRAGERAGEYEELLGYHLEQAYRHHADLGRPAAHAAKLGKQAAERIGSAGRRALARGDMPAATSLLERAVSLLPEADSLRSELSLRLSIALAETGELKRADALLSERIAAERRGQHYLLYRDGEGRQGLHDIDAAKAPITIGRRAINDIALGWDGEVSRSHAYLEWAAGNGRLSTKASPAMALTSTGSESKAGINYTTATCCASARQSSSSAHHWEATCASVGRLSRRRRRQGRCPEVSDSRALSACAPRAACRAPCRRAAPSSRPSWPPRSGARTTASGCS